MMRSMGENAPKFTLKNTVNQDILLSDYKGKYVVFYFYPKDNTPGCTLESKDFSHLKSEFEKHNAIIFGISKDSTQSHENFCQKQGLTIDLLSDPDGVVMDDYGVWREKSMYGRTFMGGIRSTFLIDKEGIIKQVWDKVKVKGHAQEVLDTLKSLT